VERVTEGKIQGAIEVTGRQGRRRRKLLYDLKERRRYSHLKEEALEDCIIWRARFGRGFGPVVRQTTKWWKNVKCSLNMCIYVYIYIYIYLFIHLVLCLTTGPKPLPKRAVHIVRSRASSFKWEYPVLSLRSSSSFLRLLPCPPVNSIPPCIFPSVTRSRFYDKDKSIYIYIYIYASICLLFCTFYAPKVHIY